MINFLKLLWYYQKIKLEEIDSTIHKEIIILGMHRSGTSLISGWLNILGVDIGVDLHGPSEANPKGFFEDSEFRNLNEEILASSGGSWDNPPSKRKILSCCDKVSEKIKKLIKKKSRQQFWGWKDPRTVLTIPLYMKFLKNPYFIVCFRNPLAVALSLYKREGKLIENGLHLASLYNQRIISFLKAYPSLKKYLVSFEKLFLEPEKELNSIIEFIGLKPSFKTYCEAIAFFDKSLKHF